MNKRKRTNEPTLLMIHETLLGHLSFYNNDEEGLERAKKQLIKGAKEFKKRGYEKDISSNLTIMQVYPEKLKKYDDKWDFPVVFGYDDFEFDESDDESDDGEKKEIKENEPVGLNWRGPIICKKCGFEKSLRSSGECWSCDPM
jgi:hypothetical protein